MPVARFALILSLLALAACGSPATETTTYIPPDAPGGRLCTAQCSEAHDFCRQDCSLKQRQCTNTAQAQGLMEYEKYMGEQLLHPGAIEYRERDFEHIEPCEHDFDSCAAGCEEPYKSCYETCGGEVATLTSCQFLCF